MRRIVLWLAFALIVNACQTTEEVAPSAQKELAPTDATKSKGYSSGRTSDTGVEPVLWDTGPGGNVTCAEVGSYAYSSGRINYDGENDVFDAPFPPGFTIVVTDGKYVSWSFDSAGFCLDGISVIVKGGNAANVYTYPADVTGDSGLASPINASGGPAGLSNLTLCYNIRPCEEEVCYQDETAWTQGTRYVSKGNWATYTSKNAGTIILYAGQTLPAGSATLTVNATTVTITISLNAGWSLQDVAEPVKIQGYAVAPTATPSPGLFATYKGTDLIVTVPVFNFYGIHLDVRKVIDCPE